MARQQGRPCRVLAKTPLLWKVGLRAWIMESVAQSTGTFPVVRSRLERRADHRDQRGAPSRLSNRRGERSEACPASCQYATQSRGSHGQNLQGAEGKGHALGSLPKGSQGCLCGGGEETWVGPGAFSWRATRSPTTASLSQACPRSDHGGYFRIGHGSLQGFIWTTAPGVDDMGSHVWDHRYDAATSSSGSRPAGAFADVQEWSAPWLHWTLGHGTRRDQWAYVVQGWVAYGSGLATRPSAPDLPGTFTSTSCAILAELAQLTNSGHGQYQWCVPRSSRARQWEHCSPLAAYINRASGWAHQSGASRTSTCLTRHRQRRPPPAAYDGGEAPRQERQSGLSPNRHASGQTSRSTTCHGTFRGSAESRADSGLAPTGSWSCLDNSAYEAWLRGGRRRGVRPGSSGHSLTRPWQIGVSTLGGVRQGPSSQFRLFCWDDELEGPCGRTVSGVKLSHLALPFGDCPLRGKGGCAELWSLFSHPGFCTGPLFSAERVCRSRKGSPLSPPHLGCLAHHPHSLLGVFPVSTPWVLVFRYRISHSSSRRQLVDMECRLGCLPVPCTVPFDLHDEPLPQPDRVPNNYIGGSGVVTCPGSPASAPTLPPPSSPVEATVALGFSLSVVSSQWLAQALVSLLPTLRFIVLFILLRLLLRSALTSRQRLGPPPGTGLSCLPLGVILAFSCFSVSQVQVSGPHTASNHGYRGSGKRPRCRRDSYPASRPWSLGLSKAWCFFLGFQTLPVFASAVPAGLPLLVRHATGLVALLPDRMPNPDNEEEPVSPPPASRWVYTRVAEVSDTPTDVTEMPKHCFLFQAGHSVRHFLAHLRAPFTKSAIVQEALDYYPEFRDHWVLHETLPQVAEGAASLVAVPSWTQATDQTVFLLDFSACNGPVFAWLDWSYVNRTSLASIARVYADTPWEVFYGNRDVPLGPDEAVTASPGHVFRFQPSGIMQLSRPLFSNMLQDMSLWLDAPPAVPRERLACDWCVMMSHVTRVISYAGYSRSEVQAQAAVALSAELNDLILGYPKPHSPLHDLVFRGTLMRGVFAAVPKSASGARVGIFAFVDPRAIGLNPTFLHVAEGDLHISQVLGIIGFQVPTGFQLQVSGVPFSDQIAQVSDECTLELSVVPVACVVPAPLQLSASSGPGHRDLASAGAERNEAHGAHTATRTWPRAFRRDDPPSPDPEAHLNLDIRDSDEEDNDVDREAFIDASFLIFAPRFQPELVRLVLQAPCDVDTALRALSETRNSATDMFFDCLLPAVPQPDTAFGSVLAVPPWDRRGSHVFGGLSASGWASFRPVLPWPTQSRCISCQGRLQANARP